MKLQYHGDMEVEIGDFQVVAPGGTVDVDDTLGERMLLAGTSIDEDGVSTPPIRPVWVHAADTPKKKPATSATDGNV